MLSLLRHQVGASLWEAEAEGPESLGKWSYRYVGPPDLRALVRPEAEGRRIHSGADFNDWVSGLAAVELAEPFTFVIDSAGVLRLAPRRSEHVVRAPAGAVRVGWHP